MSSNRNVRAWWVVVAGALAVALVAALATISPRQGARTISAEEPWANLSRCGTNGPEFLGQSEVLDKATFEGVDVWELSGLVYDPGRGVYYVIGDRIGAGIPNQMFIVDIPVEPDSLGDPAVLEVVGLKKADGTPSTGSDFDGEGIALTHQRDLLIASEARITSGALVFQTQIRRYALDGTLLGTLDVPSKFMVPPAGQAFSNLTFESMALSPNGRSLFTANEAPLSVDGVTTNREGRIRILRYEDRGEGDFVAVAEYFYLMEPARNPTGTVEVGVVEIIALSETDLLVMERGFMANQGNTVRVFQVSLAGAEDVSDEATLSSAGLVPLAKTLVLDLVTCPSGGATLPPGATQPNNILDNFEAMTLGPTLAGGRRALILVSDDNGGSNQTTRIVALAVPIPDFVGQD